MFSKVLVANRGEIAIRLLRTLRDLGIPSAAVYTQSEAQAPHLLHADEAHLLSGERALDGYLDIEQIVDLARHAGADALLPGYGFLSENPDFALACEQKGIQFVGPSRRAIADMGDKLKARELMRAAGVPVVPGGDVPDLEAAKALGREIGYPVLIKASQGGGGKGMRKLRSEAELPSALEAAQREALRAFGSDTVYIEKALEEVRHVEIQVLGDQSGNVVHLFERDCSIQRRHQKVIEETPCPGLPASVLERMTAAAVMGAKSVNYFSAGTFEFLWDGAENFYFIEMNTRLQVEHTVTELITGVDLVEQMLRVAAGQRLDVSQDDIRRLGAAIQCRIYAENPSTGFLPSTGTIEHLVEPQGPFVRNDSSLRLGSVVSPDFDPLLSKLCVWGQSRRSAVGRMRRALSELQIGGVVTNVGFHRSVLSSLEFEQGQYTTTFIDKHQNLLAPPPLTLDEKAAAVVATHLAQRKAQDRLKPRPLSTWSKTSCYRHTH